MFSNSLCFFISFDFRNRLNWSEEKENLISVGLNKFEEFAKKTPQNVQNKIQAMIIEHKDSIYQLKHSHSRK